MSKATEEAVVYDAANGIASIRLHGAALHDAGDATAAHALAAALRRATADDGVKVIVLRGAGQHFCVGHGAGPQGSARPRAQDDPDAPDAGRSQAAEHDVYLTMCRCLRESPKPTLALVQGVCIGRGLLLAWACDLIIASDDAVFSNAVDRLDILDPEIFGHAYGLHPCIAKEFLLLGERMDVQRAYQLGMVTRIVPRHFLEQEAYYIAARIARLPAPGLALLKRAVNGLEISQATPAATAAPVA